MEITYPQNNLIPEDLFAQMCSDRKIRTAITKESHFLFFNFYFAHYIQYPTAPFQREIFNLTEDTKVQNLFITAFRGSGKSTILTTSYPLWAILGTQQKKFVLLLGQTRSQAKQHLINMKKELESNILLRNDLGPFQEDRDEWGSFSLVFSKVNARITAASTEQSIRGLRHNQYRPDLIIGDDLEDLASAKTYEGRQKTYQWLTSEVIPAGERDVRLIIVGNILHEDSLLNRLERNINENQFTGVFRRYPLLDEKEEIAWPGKYPSIADIEKERKKIGNEISWQREFLLRNIADEDQVIYPEWIKYYDELPADLNEKGRKIVMGVDLAISEKETADNTAIVSAVLYSRHDDFRVYILPNPINRKMNFPATIQQIKDQYNSLSKTFNKRIILLVEEVGYQKAVIDQINELEAFRAEGVKISSDKRSRLATISSFVQNGKILFPKQGSEELVRQLVGFGKERHDDLADAFTLVAQKSTQEVSGKCYLISWDRYGNTECIYGD